ncbi:MAG: hypothetical protein RM347_017490 [Nostoc sp. ChiQUE02]|uniref:hypothetical protein n=1 Tax=Nostoc sp. ChiQUE02 TaxID=3075377 RepID=UPI002AD40602|nr:hypothetical protein [Nostoc sp. ChiQUE02]MDZ8230585.1 hypothetical protein [Nostoc sp. ChiQUE02]
MKRILAFKKWKPWSKIKFLRCAEKLIAAVGIVVMSIVFMATNTEVIAEDIYPQSNEFPLGLYSIHEAEDMRMVGQFGWKIAQTYNFTPSFLKTVAEGQMLALASLPGEYEPIPEAEAADKIATLAKSDRVAWWEFPEERRYWEDGEMAIVTNYANWTRKYDPKKRPNYMYIPSHYDATSVQQYVPYLDIIPASVYTNYIRMPHAWVRWRMESTVKGIELAQAKIGPDYLNGEKTPVAILELFHESGDAIATTEGAYHDFWQSIVSGARGILIFSYWHERDHPYLKSVLQTYHKAAGEIVGPEQLGSAILYGTRLDDVSFEILAGPERTEEFYTYGMEEPLSFPSINLLTTIWNESTYVIAVNSANEPVSVSLTGLPNTSTEATVLFENKTVPLTDGVLNTKFQPLGVHIFKIADNSSSSKVLEGEKQAICAQFIH